jgi:hypothetical protein
MTALPSTIHEAPVIYYPSKEVKGLLESGSETSRSYFEFSFVLNIDEDSFDAMALADASPSFDFLK